MELKTMSYIIMTDTSANLPGRFISKYGLEVIPFHYYIDGESFSLMDSEDFDGDGFYDRIREGLQVTTSLISPKEYMAFFEPFLKAGKDIIFVAMSSGISGSCNAAQVAADELMTENPERRIVIIDTKGASLGEGLIAIYASEYRTAGLSFEENVEKLLHLVKCMFQVFTVDDLMHLRRGGRLSNLSAIVGTVLNIKPLLKGNKDGRIVAFRKIRGRRHSVEALAQKYDKLVVDPDKQIVGIAQAGCRADADYLISMLNRNKPPKEILNVQYEPVTGSHVGPGALALFFLSHPDVRDEI